MTTDAARKAVFNTSELLEFILIYLPPKTLFGVQRVSKKFQAIIATSVPIQEKMFLRLRKKSQQPWALLRPRVGIPYFVEDGGQPKAKTCIAANLNPFLEQQYDLYRSQSSKNLSCSERFSLSISDRAKLVLDKPVSLSTLDGKGPSILDTYISDPPYNDVEVPYNYQLPGHAASVYRYMIRGERGDGTFRDLIRQTMEDDGVAGFGFGCYECDLKPLGFGEDECGAVYEARLAVEHYEKTSKPMAGFEPGVSEINLRLHYWVIPTEAERAAVRVKRKEM